MFLALAIIISHAWQKMTLELELAVAQAQIEAVPVKVDEVSTRQLERFAEGVDRLVLDW